MALQDMSAADLAAVVGNDNEGFGGNNGWWIILLFLFLGWGNNRGYGNNGGASGDMLYPWLNQSETILGGFNGVQQAICSGFANAETAATARQMADMNQMFGLQTAMMQGFTAQQAQLAQCCCENRLATANLQSVIAAENCADRQAISDGVRDLLASQNAGIQAIITKLDQQDLYAERRENDQLRQQLAMANLAASQIAQTTQIIDALKPATAAAGA
jgi:hypothetical protein